MKIKTQNSTYIVDTVARTYTKEGGHGERYKEILICDLGDGLRARFFLEDGQYMVTSPVDSVSC